MYVINRLVEMDAFDDLVRSCYAFEKTLKVAIERKDPKARDASQMATIGGNLHCTRSFSKSKRLVDPQRTYQTHSMTSTPCEGLDSRAHFQA